MVEFGLANENSFLLLEPFLLYVLVLSLPREIKHVDGVCDKVLLDGEVEGRVSGKRGRLVDLEQPGFALRVDEDIKPKYLEAH